MKSNALAWLALAFICLVWGTTYYAIRVGVQHYPPYLYAGVRQFLGAGLLLLVAALGKRPMHYPKAGLARDAAIGFLMITMGNGLVTWASGAIPSGVSALICALMPACAVLINVAKHKEDKLNVRIILGLFVGLAGVGFIFGDNMQLLSGGKNIFGMLGIFLGTAGWAFGSVLSKDRVVTGRPIQHAAVQLAFGGLFLLMASPFLDSYKHVDWFNPVALGMLAYLVVFGSALAFTAYAFALRNLPLGVVTMYSYVNPLVAVLLAYIMKDGTVSWWTLLAFVAIVAGVFIVRRGYKASKA